MTLLVQNVFYHFSPEGLTLRVHRVCLGVWPTIKARGECQGFSLKSASVHRRWMPRVLPKIYKVHPEIHKDPPQNYVTKKKQGFSPKSKRRKPEGSLRKSTRRRFLYNNRSSVQIYRTGISEVSTSNVQGHEKYIFNNQNSSHREMSINKTCRGELSQKNPDKNIQHYCW